MGTGVSVSVGLAAPQGASGGTPAPPFAFPDGETLLGVNLANINTYAGIYPFANLMYSADKWSRSVGSGSFTQSQGELVASVSTDEFRCYLSDAGVGLEAGTYTVRNRAGAEIGFGGFANQSVQAYTTDEDFSFSYTPTSAGLYLHCKGSLSKALGNLEVIAPGQVTTWDAGDVWHTDFIAFHEGMAAKVLRFMDWGIASRTIETEWADRTQPDGISFYNKHAFGTIVPYELMCDLANRLGAQPWFCVPPRATPDYVEQMAALIKVELDPTLRPFLELANEIWNYEAPWGDGTNWVEYLDHTKRIATPNFGANTFTLTGHGISNGTVIRPFATRENAELGVDAHYGTRLGLAVYVEVIDANTFKLHETSLAGPVIPVVAGQVNLLFVVPSEGGKTASLNGHYAELALRNWDIFDAEFGVNGLVHIIAGQAVNSGLAAARLTAPVLARVDAVSPAPYFAGVHFGGAVDITSGQLQPKFWCNKSCTVHIAVYADGATPTVAEIMAGTGAINKQTLDYDAGSSLYTNATAITGRTNGTAEKVHFVVADANGYEWPISGSVTVSATPSTVNILDNYANQVKRDRVSAYQSALYAQAHQAVAPDAKVICYEGGSHAAENAPAAVLAWRSAYMETPEFAGAAEAYLNLMAAAGTHMLCYFSDACPADQVFGLATDYADVTDDRYVMFSAFGGSVVATPLALSDLIIPDVQTDPGSFPHVVYTFADPTLTYSILNGDGNGNYAVVGDELHMVNDYGVDWGAPVAVNLTLEGSDGTVSDRFNVGFATGFSWYAADALFAWNAVTDTDNAVMNATVGGNLALLAGAGATIASGLWEMGGSNLYGSTTALTTALDTTKPFLFAVVIDKDDHTAAGKIVAQLGFSGFSLTFEVNSSVTTDFRAVLFNSGSVTAKFAATTPSGKHVIWAFWTPNADGGDPANSLHVGYDQIENVAAKTTKALGATSTRRLYVGGGDAAAGSQMKHGSVTVVNRAGMTFADALVEVGKLEVNDAI